MPVSPDPTAVRPTGGPVRVAAAGLVCAVGLVVAPATASAAPVPPAPPCAPPSEARSPEVPAAQAALAFERAWNLTRGRGVLVAVVDTGVDAAVPQFAGRLAPGPDLLGAEGADTDCSGHGTFLAGIVAAAPTPGSGFAGVAPDAGLVAVRYRDGLERETVAPPGDALRAAVDTGASVVLMGAPLPHGDAAVIDAVRYAEQRDVLVVTPGFTAERGVVPSTTLPAALVSVAGLEPVPTGGRTTVGPVELAAPALGVTSVSRESGGEVQAAGQEMAAAFTAGTAALVRSYRPGLTAAQVKQRLLYTGVAPIEQPGPRVLDPLGAVATVLTAQADDLPRPDRRPLAGVQVPVDDGSTTRAIVFAAVAAVLALGATVGAATLRARRRRGARS